MKKNNDAQELKPKPNKPQKPKITPKNDKPSQELDIFVTVDMDLADSKIGK